MLDLISYKTAAAKQNDSLFCLQLMCNIEELKAERKGQTNIFRNEINFTVYKSTDFKLWKRISSVFNILDLFKP